MQISVLIAVAVFRPIYAF